MTKEALEKEADEYADSVKCEWENDTYWVDCHDEVTDAYLAGAEPREKRIEELKKENAELRKIVEFQQFSNMGRYFENKKLKDTLAVGSTWNRHLNAQNKILEKDRDKYRNMVFDKNEQFDKAKELLARFVMASVYFNDKETDLIEETEKFLNEVSE